MDSEGITHSYILICRSLKLKSDFTHDSEYYNCQIVTEEGNTAVEGLCAKLKKGALLAKDARGILLGRLAIVR